MADGEKDSKKTVNLVKVRVIIKDPNGNTKTVNIEGIPDKGVDFTSIAQEIEKQGEIEKLYYVKKDRDVIPEDRRLNSMEVGRYGEYDNETGKVKTFEPKSAPELPEPKKERIDFRPLILIPFMIGNYFVENFMHMHEVTIVERETYAITLETERNPGKEYHAVNADAGQEESTNRHAHGDGKDAYSCQEQADEERASVAIYADYAETTQKIEAAVAVIENPNSTQEEINEALAAIAGQYGIRIDIRDSAEPGIAKNAERFKEAAEAHPDDRTEAEVEIVKEMVNDFHKNTEADKADLQEVDVLRDKIADGEQFENWNVTRNEDGSYEITAEQVTLVVETTSYQGLKAVLHVLGEKFGELTADQKSAKKEEAKKANTNAERTDTTMVEKIENGDDEFELID